jgi:hypothetical protein
MTGEIRRSAPRSPAAALAVAALALWLAVPAGAGELPSAVLSPEAAQQTLKPRPDRPRLAELVESLHLAARLLAGVQNPTATPADRLDAEGSPSGQTSPSSGAPPRPAPLRHALLNLPPPQR